MRLPAPASWLALAPLVVACGHVAPAPVHASAPVAAFAIEDTPPPPVVLEGTDGTELELLELWSVTDVFGPLAMTEVRATFHNPNAYAIEGRFRLALPPRASVAR